MSTTPQTLRHVEWMTAAAEEYRRLADLLGTLDDDDWRAPTDCPGWTVHDVVAHVVGAAWSTARVRELLRQAWLGRRLRSGGPLVDGINAVQVRERAAATPAQLCTELAAASSAGLRRRGRLPAALRAVPAPLGPPLRTRPLGYLTDRVYTRDVWMHRIDLARATGRPLLLTAHHDGAIVTDVVTEWAADHGRPFTLELDGPAGGRWSRGEPGEPLALDAVEFCRVLSGRAAAAGLLGHTVPF